MKPDNLRKQGANSGEQSTDEDTIHVPCRKNGVFFVSKGFETIYIIYRKDKTKDARKNLHLGIRDRGPS